MGAYAVTHIGFVNQAIAGFGIERERETLCSRIEIRRNSRHLSRRQQRAAEGRDGWLGAFAERRLRQTLKLVLPRITICIGRGQDLLLAAAAKSYLES